MSENEHFKLKLIKGFFTFLSREISVGILNKGSDASDLETAWLF